ncbi:hypothetical protein D1871_14590 [Nakamurella silvestris]|nr:hypothetical protein D1871_14590 [Nakamurella silvestris]
MTTTPPTSTHPRTTGRPARILLARSGRVSVAFRSRSLWVCAGLLVTTLVIAVLSLGTGDFVISPSNVLRTLFGDGATKDTFIIHTLRLPRLLTAVLVGIALGIGGTLFQSLSRNPLGSPDIIGFNTGAATGALFVILVFHGTANQTAVGSLIGGVATALLVYVLAITRGVHGYRLILVGIGVAAILTSVNAYLMTRAGLRDAQGAMVWLTGSLNGRSWEHVRPITLALVLLVPVALWLGRDLRFLELGDDTAGALGLKAERTRLLAVLVGVGLTALATASAGPIGFIALSAPQVARRLTGVPGPNVVPSALTGAVLLAAADLAAQRIFAPTQLPVGVMTGAIGGVYLAWLLSREWRKRRG